MEVGLGMLYSQQVVDGRVHLLGGAELKRECQKQPEVQPGVRCPTGHAVATRALGRLASLFSVIVHTTPPLYGEHDWEVLLHSCYRESLLLAMKRPNRVTSIAVPLLGAGARGAPMERASSVAAVACGEWLAEGTSDREAERVALQICVQEEDIALTVARQVESVLD